MRSVAVADILYDGPKLLFVFFGDFRGNFLAFCPHLGDFVSHLAVLEGVKTEVNDTLDVVDVWAHLVESVFDVVFDQQGLDFHEDEDEVIDTRD